MKKKFILLIYLFLPFFLFAQNNEKTKNKTFSIFTGGFIIKSSILSTTKIGLEYNKIGLLTDFTYDDYKETWFDETKSHFKIIVFSISGRYYLKPIGRNFFAEINTGIGKASLTTFENNQQIQKSNYISIIGFGFGLRFGKKTKGIFGEIGNNIFIMLFAFGFVNPLKKSFKVTFKQFNIITFQTLFEICHI